MVPQWVPVDWAQLPTVVSRSIHPFARLSLSCHPPQGLLFWWYFQELLFPWSGGNQAI